MIYGIIAIIGMFIIITIIYYLNKKHLNLNGISSNSEEKTIMKKKMLEIREGKLLFEDCCGGKLGVMYYSIGLLTIEIYDSGIIISPIFQKPVCLLSSEISKICEENILFKKVTIFYNTLYPEIEINIFASLSEDIKNQLLNKNNKSLDSI